MVVWHLKLLLLRTKQLQCLHLLVRGLGHQCLEAEPRGQGASPEASLQGPGGEAVALQRAVTPSQARAP
jgi:hypothetical protein